MEDSNLRKTRVEKLEKFQNAGINPYPTRANRTSTIFQALESEGQKVSLAGRMMSYREHGNIAFAHLRDGSGRIQIFFQKKLLGDEFKGLKLLDIGDFIQVEGEIGRTIAGEISILPISYRLLAKSLLPMPSEWYGLKDVEARYRKRYLDLLLNEDSKQRFIFRSQIIGAIREYLDKDGALEVETPTLQPLYGGANARPFITHHHALNSDFYLKISDELYLKRLVIGGIEKVYEIDHDFRNEGIDKSHNPEFTMFEVYYAYSNYEGMMELTERIWEYAANKVIGATKINYQGQEIELKAPWRRLTMKNAIKEYLSFDIDKMTNEEIVSAIQKYEQNYDDKSASRGILIAKLFEFVEEHLIQPTFITDFPKETTALCKPKDDDPEIIERFEPYINGWEVGNAYTELNNPLLQRKYFEDQLKTHVKNREEAQPLDEDFITAMEHGMPPMGGMAIGVDRMVMILTNAKNIKDVILFPTLKPDVATEKEAQELEKVVVESGRKQFNSSSISQDFSRKMAIVVNKDLLQWQVLNTVGHISAYLGNKMNTKFDTGESFDSKDGVHHPRNTQYPIIILSAKVGQLPNLAARARSLGILYHGFIREMIETTDDEEIAKILSNKEEKDIEYLGVGLFGSNEEVEQLTKNYSLWK